MANIDDIINNYKSNIDALKDLYDFDSQDFYFVNMSDYVSDMLDSIDEAKQFPEEAFVKNNVDMESAKLQLNKTVKDIYASIAMRILGPDPIRNNQTINNMLAKKENYPYEIIDFFESMYKG